MGSQLGVVQKSGAWFSYNGTQLGQGLSNSAKFLGENKDLAAEIAEEVREKAELPHPDGHLKELAAAAAD